MLSFLSKCEADKERLLDKRRQVDVNLVALFVRKGLIGELDQLPQPSLRVGTRQSGVQRSADPLRTLGKFLRLGFRSI